MTRDNLVLGLDIGTTKICAIIAKVTDDNIAVIGTGISPSLGLRKGMVVNLEATIKSIAEAVSKAERMAGRQVAGAYIGIAGGHIATRESAGMISVSGDDHEVSPDDVKRVLQEARTVPLSSDRTIIDVLPKEFIVDGVGGVKDPVGMSGIRLEVKANLVIGAVAAIQNLAKCVQRAGLAINDIILQPLASAEAVLTPLEKESGVLLVDIGGGTTDIAVFREYSVWHTGVIPVGGNHLTNDLSVGLRVGARTAEELKIKAGWSTVNQAPDGVIPQEVVASPGKTPLLYREVARIIEPRVTELFMLVSQELKERGLLDLIPAGVVLTGGTSKLEGLCEMVSDMLDLPVRQGYPQGVTGLANTVADPSCATGVGLVLLAAKQEPKVSPSKPTAKGLMDKLRYWFGEFFEMSR